MSGQGGFKALLQLDSLPNAPVILIYCPVLTNRLKYTCKFIFNHVLNCGVELTNDGAKFKNKSAFKINYSSQAFENVFCVSPSGLITETVVNENKPDPFVFKDQLCFYQTNQTQQQLPFDLFSAVFYFISRYEEWQSYEPDNHGRFELSSSLFYKNKAHLSPCVDVWIDELRTSLQKFYPELKLTPKHFTPISTIDLDNLYAYKAKGLVRTFGGAIKDLLKGKFYSFKLRLKVLLANEKDPFDIYEDVSRFCNTNKIPLVFFFLFKTGTKYDRTVNPKSKAFIPVLQTIAGNSAYFGLHPSYDSSNQPTLLANEVTELQKVSGKAITLSRQHYLKFNIRSTPNQLLQQGLQIDFTMGFASGPGFRAGTSHPFYYYDFIKEEESRLLFMPFCAMDGAYFIYNKQNYTEALDSLTKLASEIKKTGGYFTTVFHERTFFDHLYPGFGSLYKKMHLHVKALSEAEN